VEPRFYGEPSPHPEKHNILWLIFFTPQDIDISGELGIIIKLLAASGF